MLNLDNYLEKTLKETIDLATNLFIDTQTDDKLIREEIKDKENSNQAYFEVREKVRQTIEELGGTMPEQLERPRKGVKEIKKDQKIKQLPTD